MGEKHRALVSEPGGRVDEADVIQLYIEPLRSYKKPGNVVMRDAPLLKTRVGQIKRRDLRQPTRPGQLSKLRKLPAASQREPSDL